MMAPDRNEREVPSLDFCELPMVGSDKTTRDKSAIELTHSLRARQVSEMLIRRSLNAALARNKRIPHLCSTGRAGSASTIAGAKALSHIGPENPHNTSRQTTPAALTGCRPVCDIW